jgi:hypothetical protein
MFTHRQGVEAGNVPPAVCKPKVFNTKVSTFDLST